MIKGKLGFQLRSGDKSLINSQIGLHQVPAGENYQESESSVEEPLPMICTRKIYFSNIYF